jgi:hypothetical protein
MPVGLAKTFLQLIGELLFLSKNTRCDITHAVGVLSRAMAASREADLEAAKGVLWYFKGTEEDGIVLGYL